MKILKGEKVCDQTDSDCRLSVKNVFAFRKSAKSSKKVKKSVKKIKKSVKKTKKSMKRSNRK